MPWTERRLWQVQRSQGLQDIRMVPWTRNYWSSTWYWENVFPYGIHLWPREEQCSNFQRTGLSRLRHCWYGKTRLHIKPRKPFSYMHISLTGARSWTWFHSAFGSEILMQPCADCVLYIFLRVLLAFEFRTFYWWDGNFYVSVLDSSMFVLWCVISVCVTCIRCSSSLINGIFYNRKICLCWRCLHFCKLVA